MTEDGKSVISENQRHWVIDVIYTLRHVNGTISAFQCAIKAGQDQNPRFPTDYDTIANLLPTDSP